MPNPVNPTPGHKQDDISYVGYYAALFFDILNQRDAVRRLEHLPKDDTQRSEYILALKQSAGKVLALRSHVESFFQSYINTPPAYLDKLSEAQKAEFRKLKGSTVETQRFSDTVIAYAPLSHDGVLSVSPVYAILAAGCSIMLTTLGTGIPIRGGLEVSVALTLSDRDLYGPAVCEAYRLESQVARYPRIAVGARLLRFPPFGEFAY